MGLRLVVSLDGGRLRVPLEDGEHVVGSDADCAIVLPHASVSRRHALVVVRGESAEIEDLDSTNGVIVGARRVRRETVRAGDLVYFGRVSAVLERVAPEDLEVALPIGESQGRRKPTVAHPEPQATVVLAPVERFALDDLPQLLKKIASGSDVGDVARAVGAALLSSLNCGAVEIAKIGKTGEGLLFQARRSDALPSGSTVVERAGPAVLVRGTFDDGKTAELFAPVIEDAAWLIGLGASSPIARSASPHESGAPLPDPPSIVSAVTLIYQQAQRVAKGDVSVLITGESGTGKEVLARYVHQSSPRARGPFIALNCAALPRDLLESELFGIERGVATGVDARPGKFELADGGTLFLDEIGDMAPETQASLLRVLQEREVYRIGGREPHPARIRVVAATNRDLTARLADGRFREDLYHRIATWVVELPPLRRRSADIPNLAGHFLAREAARHGRRAGGISRAAIDALRAFDWPGNIRQLENEMSRAVLFLEDDEVLDTVRLSPEIVSARGRALPRGSLEEMLAAVERTEIVAALEAARGDLDAARERLGISRATLYRRMKALGVEPR
jgi:MoxR-like ATPase